MTAERNTLTPDGSVAKLLAWRAAERRDFGLMYVEAEGPWTVGAIAHAAQRLADELRRAGAGPGDRILVRLGNDERYLAALNAAWLIGGSAIAMHPATPRTDAERVVEMMAPRVVLADPDDAGATGLGIPHVPVPHLEKNAAATRLDPPHVNGTDEALVLLTSGSTGSPKGVVLTHGNAWANLRATVSAFRSDTRPTPLPAEPKPPNLIANPVSHTAGVVRLLFALYVGRSVVLLRKFDAHAAKAALDRHGIDNLTINPTMMRMLLEDLPAGADLGAVRYVSSGTAPLPAALREAFEARFGIPVLQAYGQTEAFGGVAIENVKDVLAGRRKPGSVGRALPGVEIRIAEDGEILVRSQSSTAGYLGQGASPVDPDGWLHTGDLGRLDEDGYLFVTGRLKSLIICGGFNIVPEEVEAALAADGRVREAAVVGVPDDRLGELPVAVVESDDDANSIVERLRDRLVAYKLPRRVMVVDRLPRVPNGKIDTPAVRAMVESSSN